MQELSSVLGIDTDFSGCVFSVFAVSRLQYTDLPDTKRWFAAFRAEFWAKIVRQVWVTDNPKHTQQYFSRMSQLVGLILLLRREKNFQTLSCLFLL